MKLISPDSEPPGRLTSHSPDAPSRATADALQAETIERRRAEERVQFLLSELSKTQTALGNEQALRLAAETELSEREARHQRLLNLASAYDYSVDMAQGRPAATTHGPGCFDVTGYRPEEYNEDPALWFTMIHEEDRDAVLAFLRDALPARRPLSLDHRIIHKDGSPRWIRNVLTPRSGAGETVSAYDGLITDITAYKALEEQLRQSQKMETLGALTAGMAHDFNNILTAIMGHANLLGLKMKERDSRTVHVDQLLDLTERAARLTRNLLTFARKETLHLAPVDVNDAVRRVQQILTALIGEDIELSVRLAPAPLVVMADTGQIEQALINLATNARDAMPRGGRLTIETASAMDGSLPEHRGEASAAMITVSDTGVGMNEDTRLHIFEPFFTTKATDAGTGLGLAIVDSIIKRHNGSIHCSSEPGRGSAFRIFLPLTEARPGSEAPTDELWPSTGTETVLVAEDDADARYAVAQVLSESGYRVVEAADGDEAITKFHDNRDRIGLVILDVIMPGKNGEEVYREITRIKPGTPAIFTSGYPAATMRERGVVGICRPLLAKPLSPSAIARQVRRMLDAGSDSRIKKSA